MKDAILSTEAPPRALRALSGPLPRWFPPLAGAALGAVFLLAAAAKGADPHAFVEQVESYRIVTGAGARAFAYALVPVEAALGTSLLLGLFRRAGMLASALLLLFFIGVTAYGWSQGRIEGCGCFGVLMGSTLDGALVRRGCAAARPRGSGPAPCPRGQAGGGHRRA